MVEFALVRSRRKTLAIHILPDGSVEVRAPLKLARREIDAFVSQKEPWIAAHQAECRQRCAQQAAFVLDYGARILFLGQELVIRAGEGSCRVEPGRLIAPGGLDDAGLRRELEALYRRQASVSLPERVAQYGAIMGLTPKAVTVTGAKTRWGSCSSAGRLCFSWRLMAAPLPVVDYVAVHELAHLAQHNHSPAFWAVVGAVLPDYRARRQALRDLGRRLSLEGWM